MKKILFFLLVVFLWSCETSSVNDSNLHFLNGYWEISEVEFPDGSIKEYGLSPNIDFIQLEDQQGFRKKLQPKFDGTYDTSNDLESFTLAKGSDSYILQYKNNFSEWEETLVQLDSVSFAVTNQEGITYSYKRFEPIQIPK